ncbi:cobyrinic acid a,c-diamide synthase [Pontibacillus chungwhensis BH030062]|uniref:Cobyrinic acid a,c-diamide synthase n=1 Tax=Pontibacillus chungwhensis BH030062 TaxID=1385513 RepID=A0A0A2VH15_9BACI|nr:MinD/ParA family protein [Pontibacillus chungwhensis]KGP92875.1 cobyrinic acid a,c-diamide synthase [Pontibacillus chungwhensis BH030062]
MSDQASNLREKLKYIKTSKEAKTIAVTSGKGGVGKSNFALNFGLTLADKGKRVLLFDLDIGMGNIDILLGLTPKRSIVDMFENNLSIFDIIENGPKSLSYIAGGSGLSTIFTFNDGRIDYFFDQLEKLMQSYDYILFDMGAGITHEGVHFILASNECIVVTTPEPTSLTDAYAMMKHIHQRTSELPIRVVVNRSFSNKSGDETLKRLQTVAEQFLNRTVYALGILPDDRTVVKAVTAQVPYTIYNDKAPVSKAINEITLNYLGDRLTVNPKRSFLSRLKHSLLER